MKRMYKEVDREREKRMVQFCRGLKSLWTGRLALTIVHSRCELFCK